MAEFRTREVEGMRQVVIHIADETVRARSGALSNLQGRIDFVPRLPTPGHFLRTLISKEALIAAVASHTGSDEAFDTGAGTGTSASVTAAVDIRLSDINENSPHRNSATIVGAVTNNANVVGTTGINQLQQAAGVSNVHSSSNLIVVDVSNLANGPAFGFNQ